MMHIKNNKLRKKLSKIAIINIALGLIAGAMLLETKSELQAKNDEIIFISSSVIVNNALENSLPQFAEIIYLDNNLDAIQQITQALANKKNLDAIRIISHGQPGQLLLSGNRITEQDLEIRQEEIRSWKNSLGKNADILLYGCNIAANVKGRALVNELAKLTDADVAASTNKTGGIENDWTLEFQTGCIDTKPISAPNYPNYLETYTVTSISDDGTGSTIGTLSNAIIAANSTTGVDDLIVFDLTSGSTVIISAALPDITDGLFIDGKDLSSESNVTVQVPTPGTSSFRVFNINASGETITIENMIIKGGNIAQGGVAPPPQGGGINLVAGTLNLNEVTVSDSKANFGGGIGTRTGSTLILSDSKVIGNTATADGGGIFSYGTTTISNSTISGNTAENTDGGGGGITNFETLTLLNSTISGNTTFGVGGGIYSFFATTNISNSTISGNSATLNGGGLHNDGTLTIKNTILANNTSDALDTDYYYEGGSITDNGYNVVEFSNRSADLSGGFNHPNDILYNTKYGESGTSFTSWTRGGTAVSGSLNLSSTLTDNGGLTPTLAITEGSFVGSAGIWDASITSDQRGYTRHNPPSIGAFEFFGNINWTGTTDTDWNTASNWDRNQIPLNLDDASIPDVSNDPVISSTTAANINDLSVASGASLSINSDAANNGSLKVEGTSSGNITYNRYVTGVDKWHLISSPVGEQSINAFVTTNAVAFESPKYGLAPFDNTTKTWTHYTTSTLASAGNFIAGKGYEVLRTSDGTLSFTGTVATANVGIAITKNTSGWNLVGNPFPSAINGNDDADSSNNFLTVNTAAIDENYLALYVWDAASSSYLTVNHDFNSNSAFYVAPGQAFFVYSPAGGSTINFTEATQTHQTGDIFKSGEIENPSIKLIAERAQGTSTTNIKYLNNMSTGLDPGYDAGRFSAGDNSFAVYTHLVGDDNNLIDFDIQCLPANEYDHIIPLGLNAPENSEVIFRAETINLPTDVPVYLEDRVLGKFIALHAPGSFYAVTITEKAEGIGRFFLYTKSVATNIESVVESNDFTIIPRPQNNSIRIIGDFKNASEVAVYDLSGRKLISRKLNTSSINDIEMGGLISGFYLVSINSKGQRMSKKISWIRNE